MRSATGPESHKMNQPSSTQRSHCLFRGEGNTNVNRYYQEALVLILALSVNVLGRFLTQSFWGGARSWFLICAVVYNIKRFLYFLLRNRFSLYFYIFCLIFDIKVVCIYSYEYSVALHVYNIQHSNQSKHIFSDSYPW